MAKGKLSRWQKKAGKGAAANSRGVASPPPVTANPDKAEKSQAAVVKEPADDIVVEIDSFLKNFLTLMLLFYGIFALLTSIGMYAAFASLLPDKAMMGVYSIIAVHGLFLFLLFLTRKGYNSFYIVSEKSRTIDSVVRLGPWSIRNEFTKFENVEVVTATGIRKRTTRHPIDKWYVYTVFLLEKNGACHEFARESRDLGRLQKQVKLISRVIGCNSLTCEKENVMKVQKTEGKVRVELSHYPIKDFTGNTLPIEQQRQMINMPVILGSFFLSFVLVFSGTAVLLMLMGSI